jgi:hypothetical protein
MNSYWESPNIIQLPFNKSDNKVYLIGIIPSYAEHKNKRLF